MELPFALLLGAIASATAPAATVAIVQSLRAHGDFVDYLYGVVALDDAGSVILFGIIFAFVSGMAVSTGQAALAPSVLISRALLEVILSVLVGVISGFAIHLMTRRLFHNGALLIITLGGVLLATALASSFHLSPLLTNMAAGAALINLSTRNRRLFRNLGPLTPPIYALFFVIAGTELNPRLLLTGGILVPGTVYISSRAVGKYGGVWLGSVLAKTTRGVRDFLGICMLPQAGVAIGLVLLIEASPLRSLLPPGQAGIISDMVNIVLLSVFFNELVGPPLSRFAIIRGNEMEA
jgi:Kef-type K+ transport system membrane component KefB